MRWARDEPVAPIGDCRCPCCGDRMFGPRQDGWSVSLCGGCAATERYPGSSVALVLASGDVADKQDVGRGGRNTFHIASCVVVSHIVWLDENGVELRRLSARDLVGQNGSAQFMTGQSIGVQLIGDAR